MAEDAGEPPARALLDLKGPSGLITTPATSAILPTPELKELTEDICAGGLSITELAALHTT